ncbi:MAG: anthranilate phosphoribosyltransferase [Terrimicrobiaceae bacterium]
MKLEDILDFSTPNSPLPPQAIPAAVAFLLDESQAVDQRASLLEALHRQGESDSLLAGFASELLARATPLPGLPSGLIDVCGTGGDQAGFFNVSTAVMFVAAGAGARVAKHGNRGITSRSGGADALEALGVRIDHPPDEAAALIREAGCGFLFAPLYHACVKAVAPVRKFLADRGTPTIFNLLGPLINPARPEFQLVGIYRQDVLAPYAGALKILGRSRAWVVNGSGTDDSRLDEISPFGPTHIVDVDPSSTREFVLNPSSLGILTPGPASLLGGSAIENATIIRGILENSDHSPRRTMVELNAAAALVVSGLAPNLSEGLAAASLSINSGAALAKLHALQAAS